MSSANTSYSTMGRTDRRRGPARMGLTEQPCRSTPPAWVMKIIKEKKSIAPHGPPAQLDFASYVAPSPRLALGAATWTPRLGGLQENASCRHRSYGSTKARTDNALWVQVGTGSLQLPARQLGNRPSPRRSPTCKGHLPTVDSRMEFRPPHGPKSNRSR